MLFLDIRCSADLFLTAWLQNWERFSARYCESARGVGAEAAGWHLSASMNARCWLLVCVRCLLCTRAALYTYKGARSPPPNRPHSTHLPAMWRFRLTNAIAATREEITPKVKMTSEVYALDALSQYQNHNSYYTNEWSVEDWLPVEINVSDFDVMKIGKSGWFRVKFKVLFLTV